uniref:Putative invertase inhibitor n=1 Tax=Anthurium amnicola TaxID=1678845 RepID=A0A1D1Y9C7_9ARAE
MESRRIAQQLHLQAVLLLLLLLIMAFIKLGASARLLGEANGTDLITSTCRHTEHLDVCISTLQSHRDSRSADVKGLALVSVEACIAHAEGTLSYVKQLRGNGGEGYAAECLDDCLTEYSDALEDLRGSVGELQRGAYDSVNAMVSGAMTDSDTCEGGFGETPGYSSPLTERNDYFSMLCSNSLAIAALLSF